MTMGKDTTQKFFIDESRIWNFSSEKIKAANVTSYTFNYMSDKNLIKVKIKAFLRLKKISP